MDNVTREILTTLKSMYPDAKCELEYQSSFELLVAVILSAQCTDVRVNKVTRELFKQYNKPYEFKNLENEKLEKIIFSCGFYKQKAKSIINTSRILVDEYDSKVPDKMELLEKLPGVGRKTANVILSEAFGYPAIAVDTHVFRVSRRLGLSNATTPEGVEKDLRKVIDKNMWSISHHLLIFHGRYTCKSRNPECDRCMVKKYCKYINQEHKS